MFRERLIVDDRVFLLGLDEVYRTAMMRHESDELLLCARVVSAELSLSPHTGPVEGYYPRTAELTEYFRLLRSLQEAGEGLRPRVSGLAEFQRLEAVASSPLFGNPGEGTLLPRSQDPLHTALSDSLAEEWGWSITRLVESAHRAAVAADDYSLVGLAALVRDPVVLAATRESTVLYADIVPTGALHAPEPKHVWRVSRELARQASRFVSTFNELFDDDLPAPAPKNAEYYWGAAARSEIIGRCVALGKTQKEPVRYYHWAIAAAPDGKAHVEDFWDTELWTTDRYCEKIGRRPRRSRFWV